MLAHTWFHSEPIPSLGNLTAEELVKRGEFESVIKYLARIEDGGYS